MNAAERNARTQTPITERGKESTKPPERTERKPRTQVPNAPNATLPVSERSPERKTPNAPNASPERSDRERRPNAERTERRARTHRTRGTQTLSC